MRSFRTALLVSTTCLALGAPRAFADGFTLFSRIWGNAIVATDVTPEGKAVTPPTRENPVYYVGRSLGCRLGSIGGDKHPSDEEMNQVVAKVLAKQGYIGTRPELHEPSLLLVVQWGYLYRGSQDMLWFLGYDKRKDAHTRMDPSRPGPERFLMRSRETETIMDYAGGSVYGIIVTAFEYKSINTPDPVIYWQSRIGLPANGKSMAQALPTMVIAAGSAIGRDSDQPILLDVDNVREGTVELGEAEFIEYESEPAKKD